MQNAGIAALGLNWRYLAFNVHPDKLKTALEGARAMGFIGINLTVPHKLMAVDMIDLLDESAKAAGAVNTIRFEGRTEQGEWLGLGQTPDTPVEVRSHGFNTDADAITTALRKELGLEPAGTTVLLLGAGGAGRTAALKLAAEGAKELFLVNRTKSKAEGLAGEIARRHPNVKLTVGYPKGSVDLVLNATSVGLKPADDLPFDRAQFSISKANAVYDMIYRPAETELLKSAKSAGCRTANGIGMLLYQGAKALEIWAGRPAPLEIMRQALEQNVYE